MATFNATLAATELLDGASFQAFDAGQGTADTHDPGPLEGDLRSLRWWKKKQEEADRERRAREAKPVKRRKAKTVIPVDEPKEAPKEPPALEPEILEPIGDIFKIADIEAAPEVVDDEESDVIAILTLLEDA